MRRILGFLFVLFLLPLSAHAQSIYNGSVSTDHNRVTVTEDASGGWSGDPCDSENPRFMYSNWLVSGYALNWQVTGGPGGYASNITQTKYAMNCGEGQDNEYTIQFTFADTSPGNRTLGMTSLFDDDASTYSQATDQVTYTVPGGSISPKYVVLSVIYAPPGHSSNVDYGTSTVMGTSSSTEHSFSSNTTITQSFSANVPILGSIDRKNSASWTQTADNTSSISVWLNPAADFTLTSSTGAIWNFRFDEQDPADEVDGIDLYGKDLKALRDGTFNGDPNIPQRLARTWAQANTDGSGPGLTSQDYAAILASDPFANGQTPIDSTRFDLEGGSTFPYQPPPCGFQPDTTVFNQSYQTTSTQGTTATDEHSVEFSLSDKGSFLGWFNANYTASQMFKWTNKWGHQVTQGSGQSAKLSITGPSDCTYSGLTNVQVYQDNVYGTFMFAFVQ